MEENKWLKYLTYINSILLITIILSSIFWIIYNVFDYIPNTTITRFDLLEITNSITQFVLTFGVILAYIEYKTKRVWENKKGLELGLIIQKKQDENLILFKTSVSNHTSNNIEIESAFILITPHNKKFMDVFNESFGKCFRYSNELKEIKELKQQKPSECFVINLNYYYEENIQVGNETLRYVKPMSIKENESDKIQLWDVRFFVFPKKGHHRSVHSAFQGIIDKDSTNNSSNSNLKTKKLKNQKL